MANVIPTVHTLKISRSALVHYARTLCLANPNEALHALARAIACSPGWDKIPGTVLVVRPFPQPVLAIMGRLDEARRAWLAAQAAELGRSCALLRYVGYPQAETDCRRLADLLVRRFGRKELARFHFTGIPRGGLVILGVLACALGLEARQLSPPSANGAPVVVVDDCALTGARFGGFLEKCRKDRQVIFAHLYSHPQLRRAIETRERRVLACISAHDLRDHGARMLGRRPYLAARRRLLARIVGPRYWVGMPDHICFPWGEPDRSFWNPVTRRMEDCWRIVPPELCLKNRLRRGRPIPLHVLHRNARLFAEGLPEGRP